MYVARCEPGFGDAHSKKSKIATGSVHVPLGRIEDVRGAIDVARDALSLLQEPAHIVVAADHRAELAVRAIDLDANPAGTQLIGDLVGELVMARRAAREDPLRAGRRR